MRPDHLISYIAPGAPATRRPMDGDEPYLRPEVGFTPKWYHQALGIDFGERWHADSAYRRGTVVAMRAELHRRFPCTRIGRIDRPSEPLDLLTGTFGACVVAGIYGVPLVFAPDGWPDSAHHYLDGDQADALTPPDLDANPFLRGLLDQVDQIAALEGRVEGYINWQGVLNNAHRLRGQALFMDIAMAPERARRLLDCVAATMTDATRRLYERQRATGVEVSHFTVSNCLVNMVSPEVYREFLLPHDVRFAEAFGLLGIHNCAWRADPYVPHYATVPNVGYIDMGLDSDLIAAREAFPNARRALMYTPMDLARRTVSQLRDDFERIARDFGPCDLVLADIEAGTPDERVRAAVNLCGEISRKYPLPGAEDASAGGSSS
ncbi:MAG TPA: uroporphyrinogen decarboxylase family protein [Planctomycetota bacterium]|nr:uroporphyrinogen decarboxylase family protein [Planctomycetota bacterium]